VKTNYAVNHKKLAGTRPDARPIEKITAD